VEKPVRKCETGGTQTNLGNLIVSVHLVRHRTKLFLYLPDFIYRVQLHMTDYIPLADWLVSSLHCYFYHHKPSTKCFWLKWIESLKNSNQFVIFIQPFYPCCSPYYARLLSDQLHNSRLYLNVFFNIVPWHQTQLTSRRPAASGNFVEATFQLTLCAISTATQWLSSYTKRIENIYYKLKKNEIRIFGSKGPRNC